MTAENAHWATQQDQSSGEAAAIRVMRFNDSAVQWIALSGCRICEAQNAKLNEIDLVSIDDPIFGGWKEVQPKHFGDGGIFDKLYAPN